MSVNDLPDELWRRILQIGINSSNLTYKDLCCVSISSRRLRRLSGEESIWSYLLASDFPQKVHISSSSSSSSMSAKSLYRIRFEREKERRVAAHRRALLRKESEVAERRRKIRNIESQLAQETDRFQATLAELSNLHKVRQASVALNVWQPEVISSRQKQIVQQNVVPAETRIHALEMELKLCKQQVSTLKKGHKDEKQRHDRAKEELETMKYHPLRDYKVPENGDSECKIRRKRMKTCVNFPEKLGETS